MKKFFILLFMQIALCCSTFAANYLTFTAEKDNSSFSIEDHDIKSNIFYSLDNGETWIQLTQEPVSLSKGNQALLKGNGPNETPSWYSYSNFKMTGSIAASGSVMSLIDGDGESKTIPYEYCFQDLFKHCSSLTQAPELPATTLAERCYSSMFLECTSLTQAPKLPATTLAEGCYSRMFGGCTSLTQAPELPATTLAEECYSFMFSECSSLTQAPELPATTLAENCYSFMFSECSSLTQAPELPATTLAVRCYGNMFSGCKSLTQAPKLPATTLAGYCYNGMFNECTSLTQAPELPATTLAECCYYKMFCGCEKLSHIKVAFTDWGTYTYYWLANVAKNGTFICPKELSLEYGDGVSKIPNGWTVKTLGADKVEAVAAAESMKVQTSGLTIFIRNADADIEVYEVGGKLIGKVRTMNGEAQITVPQSGIYLVKAGAQTRKVVL